MAVGTTGETLSTTSSSKPSGSDILPMILMVLGKFTSQGSGILITMVGGGAVVPPLQGFLADKLGYQASFIVVLLCYAYLVFFALRGYKIQQPRYASLPDYVPPVEP